MNQSILLFSGICLLFFVIMVLRKKPRLIINFFIRMIIGGVGIYLVNLCLTGEWEFARIALNPVTLCTSGILGLPGLLAMYGAVLYKNR